MMLKCDLSNLNSYLSRLAWIEPTGGVRSVPTSRLYHIRHPTRRSIVVSARACASVWSSALQASPALGRSFDDASVTVAAFFSTVATDWSRRMAVPQCEAA